jgi:hypothetical protein
MIRAVLAKSRIIVTLVAILLVVALVVPVLFQAGSVSAGYTPPANCLPDGRFEADNTAGVNYFQVWGGVDAASRVNLSTQDTSDPNGPYDYTATVFTYTHPSYHYWTYSTDNGFSAMEDCTPSTPGPGTTTTSAPVYNDPPEAGPRVWSMAHVIFNQPYGYQFYTSQGQVIGLVDLNAVGIPGPGQMITSMSTDGGWRVDLYYHGGDTIQSNLYHDGNLVEEGYFDVLGIGARAGQVAGQSVPGFGGQGGTVAASSFGTVQVMCRQNLRQNASVETAVLSVLEPGVGLNVVGRSNDAAWLEVVTPDGIRGWAFNGRCLNVGNQSVEQAPVQVVFDDQPTVNPDAMVQQQAPAAAPQTVAAPAADGPLVGITCRQNMRTGPGTSFTVDRVLVPGTNLTVIGRSNDGAWLQVSGAGFSGWTYFGQCVLPQQGDVTAAPVTVAFGG